MKIVQQYQQQTGISELAFENENKLDELKGFRGRRGNVNRRIAPLCPRCLASLLCAEWPPFQMTSFCDQALRAWPASLCYLQVRNEDMHWMLSSEVSSFLWLVGPIWSSSLTGHQL